MAIVLIAIAVELIYPGFSLIKGFCRSALGTALDSMLGELYQFHSVSYGEDKSATMFLQSPPRPEEVCPMERRHRNNSMGLALGISGLLNLANSSITKLVLGTGACQDAVGQGVNFCWIMTAYELTKCFPGETTNACGFKA